MRSPYRQETQATLFRLGEVFATEPFEAQHWARQPLDASVVLFNDIVQIFALTDLDARLMLSIHLFQACCIRTTLINSHQTGFSVLNNRFFQKA